MRAVVASVLASLAWLLVACASSQPVELGVRRQGLTWKADVAPALAQSCASCHSGSEPAGGLSTDDYFQVIARARAGDATSRLLTIQTDATHASLASSFKLLRTWVVDDDLGYETSPVHGAGLMNPSDSTFHGQVVRDFNWNLSLCTQCHGTDFGGGSSGVTCKTCHDGGLTSCTGCHGQPPATGAHVAHVTTGAIAATMDCVACHIKPAVYTDAGHLHDGPGAVRFGDLATAQSAAPTYTAATQTCSGVYCHGGAFTDTAATLKTPTWKGTDQAACGTCHGLPPSGHVNTGDQCVTCHPSVVDDQRHIVDKTKHVNGNVDFGTGDGLCTSCHGQPPATGTHLAHTTAAHMLAAPVECVECHTVPATIDAPGHLTSPAQVTMSGVRATGSGETQPTFNAQTQTCANVHCHGSEAPVWGSGVDAIACGACHGVPPTTAPHEPGFQLSDCARCHSATVTEGGAIKVGGGHINGVIDVD